MTPTLADGDRLLVSYRRAARRAVRPGDLVVARLADGTVAVKRATQRRTTSDGSPAWWLLSDNPDVGIDSRHRGPVADQDVIAVTVVRVWPHPRRL
jgi:phage repressor protein C with HTH and peptisase S24 domain